MSIKQDSLFCTLPVELIFRIFRHLDAQTIVRSFRIVCKRFYTIVNVYDEFNLNFNSILKSDFHCLCNLVQPKHVKSLTLSDGDETPGQIGYFLSRFRIKQFTQLRSLTLIEIDECHLNIILKDVNKLVLDSLSIDSKQDYSENTISTDDLSSAFTLSSLRKLDFNILSFDMSKIVWPIECTIQHLEIYCRTLDEYCNIIYHLPNLRTLVVEQLDTYNTDGTMPELDNMEPCCQLFSLTFKYCTINMILLELLLSLTPSIKYLQLMRSVDLHGFISHVPQWEKFVETILPSLNKFEFFLTDDHQFFTPPVNIEQLIAPFRTSFWTEMKRWSVICDYIMNPRTVILYSPSVVDSQFTYVFESKQIRRSTSTPTINNTIIMDGVRKLRLDLNKAIASATSSQGGLANNALFPKVDHLTLYLIDKWPLGGLRLLSTLINLSHLTKLSLEIGASFTYCRGTISKFDSLFKLTKNMLSLKITFPFFHGTLNDCNVEICSVVPDHVRHLIFPVSSVYQMHMVRRRLKCRSSIRYQYCNVDLDGAEAHIAWFKHEKGYYTYRLNDSSLSMWFDKYVNASYENLPAMYM